MTQNTCPHCLTSFTPKYQKTQKFCSKSCSTIRRNQNISLKLQQQYYTTPKLCKYCQKLMSYHNRKNSFCNSSCAAFYNNLHSSPNRKRGPARQIPFRYLNCDKCGALLEHRRKYCSIACSAASKKINRTIEETKALHREHYRRYIAQRTFQTPIDADLTAIKEFYKNCPRGFEVDHIIPISKGGSHSIENMQYLTILENRKKSNKIL